MADDAASGHQTRVEDIPAGTLKQEPMRYASTGISSIERHGMSGAIASSPTAEMRKQLAAQSIPIPSATELVSYSQKMNTWINDWRREQNKEPSHSWFNLFAIVDKVQVLCCL